MALVINDRVKETSTSTGTGTFNLDGAVTGFDTFVTGIADSNTTYYAIFHQGTTEWEVGLGTVTDAATDTLARTTVISSSTGSAVDFAAGTKDVFCTLPASKAVFGKQEGTNFTDSLIVGHSTTGTLSSASDNTGVGIGALDALTSGTRNTAVGQDAGTSITTAMRNVMFGHNAGLQMTTNGSYDNTLIGDSAGAIMTSSCFENTLLGKSAGYVMNVGDKNVVVGAYAGQGITHGDRNVMIGVYAGDNLTTGDGNIIIGADQDTTAVDSARTLKIVSYDGTTTTNHILSDGSGNMTLAADLTIGDDFNMTTDSSVINFGADSDTTLTHTDGTGLTLNSTNKLCFNDASQFVYGVSNAILGLGATD